MLTNAPETIECLRVQFFPSRKDTDMNIAFCQIPLTKPNTTPFKCRTSIPCQAPLPHWSSTSFEVLNAAAKMWATTKIYVNSEGTGVVLISFGLIKNDRGPTNIIIILWVAMYSGARPLPASSVKAIILSPMLDLQEYREHDASAPME